MNRSKIKILIAGALVSVQLFGPSAFSTIERANAAELGGKVAVEKTVQPKDAIVEDVVSDAITGADVDSIKEDIENDDELSSKEKSVLNQLVESEKNIAVEEAKNDSQEEAVAQIEKVDTNATTQAAVVLSDDNKIDYLNINLDAIHISEDNYVEDMKNIVEPYIDSRKETGYINGVDNAQLYYEKYYNADAIGNIVISHGFTENLEKYNEMIYYFLNNGYNVFGIEHRGHGRSGSLGVQDSTQIHVNNFNDYVDDLKTFMDEVVVPNSDNKKVFLYAHSMGGAIGAKFLEDNPQYFNASILSSPMLEINTGKIPEDLARIISKAAILFGQGGKYAAGQGPYNPNERFEDASTSCESRYNYISEIKKENPEFQKGGGSYKWLYECLSKTKQITNKNNASKVETPVLLFQAEKDDLVRPKGQNDFAKYAKDCTLERVSNSKHEVYFEKDSVQKTYLQKVFDFFKKHLFN